MAKPSVPSLAIVIVNYRTADYVISCVESLAPERKITGSFEVIIVDGGSGDGSADTLTAHFADAPWRDWVSVLPLDLNGGFGWANNQAMLRLLQRPDAPDYIHLLNPDTVVEPGAVKALLDVIVANPKLGGVGSRLIEPDGAPAGSAFSFPSPMREFLRGCNLQRIGAMLGMPPAVVELGEPGPTDWITGASTILRSEALREVGLFDDGFFLYFEEVELMHRMRRAGWDLWFVPASRILHIGGAATGMTSGVQAAVRPLPVFHFESRRRYFVRTGGGVTLMAANLAWLFGRLIGVGVELVRGKRTDVAPKELSMTLRHSFWPSGCDGRASVARWDEPPGRAPAWTVK